MSPTEIARLLEAVQGIDSKLGQLVEAFVDERAVIADQLGDLSGEILELRELIGDGIATMGRVVVTPAQRVEWRAERDAWLDRAMAAVRP